MDRILDIYMHTLNSLIKYLLENKNFHYPNPYDFLKKIQINSF